MEWKVKTTGKLIYILSHLVFSFSLILWFSARIDRDPNQEYLDALIDSILFTIGFGFMFIIAGVFYPIYWILKKKIPNNISISIDSKITFKYKRKKNKTYTNSILAFSIYQYNLYSTLVFYRVYKAENGQKVYKELFDVIATKTPFSWQPSMFNEIAEVLISNGYKKLKKTDEKNYLTRILG